MNDNGSIRREFSYQLQKWLGCSEIYRRRIVNSLCFVISSRGAKNGEDGGKI